MPSYDNVNSLSEVVEALPSSWYYDREIYQKELTSIWYRNWIFVCHSNALSEPRAYKTIQIGTQNIIVLKDKKNI